MCGIIGIIDRQDDVAQDILDGLKRLEYRGYDSAGIATLDGENIERRRAEGKLKNLGAVLGKNPLSGRVGIGHTRWATHGAPCELNAHPHATDQVALVHNGIIENYVELKERLQSKGHKFASETDTETIVHLLTDYIQVGLSAEDAVKETLKDLDGAFALAMIFTSEPNTLYIARRGSPLVLGYGKKNDDGYEALYVGSDAVALAPLTRQVTYLEEGDWAKLSLDNVEIFDAENNPAERTIKQVEVSGALIGKENYRHYMLKEIHEQPGVLANALHSYLNPLSHTVQLPYLPFDLDEVERVLIVACGTSSYSAMVAKNWLERYAQMPVQVDIASEFRYRTRVVEQGTLAIFISQSGETADTLAALRHVKELGIPTLGIINVDESSIAREADAKLLTMAGPEIGVASTKAFTAQLITLAVISLTLAHNRGTITEKEYEELSHALTEVPAAMSAVLNRESEIEALAQEVVEAKTILYCGRGLSFPIALEGALKLKEISYIHAEGFAAGEMKHGPIALIDENVPVVFVAPPDDLYEKTISNMQEAMARGAPIVLFTDHVHAKEQLKQGVRFAFGVDDVNAFISPLIYTVPVQLLAYHVAVLKGTDVDQPRNLAKSVTVE